MYYLAVNWAEALAGHRPVRGVGLAFLKEIPKNRDRDAPTGAFQTAYLAVTPALRAEYQATMVQRLEVLIGRIGDLLESESYRPNPMADCWFCRFKTICPLFPEGRPLFPNEQRPQLTQVR